MFEFLKDADLGLKILAGIGILWILQNLFGFTFSFAF